jgi:hypothetical protein
MKQDQHGFGGNESVKRLRKPEGAAQPGEVTPVSVAPRHLERCRGRDPRRVSSSISVSFSATREGGRSVTGQTLESGQDHERIRRELHRSRRPGTVGRPRRPTSQGAKAKGGSSTNTAIPRTSARLCRSGKRQERTLPSRQRGAGSSIRSQDSEGDHRCRSTHYCA